MCALSRGEYISALSIKPAFKAVVNIPTHKSARGRTCIINLYHAYILRYGGYAIATVQPSNCIITFSTLYPDLYQHLSVHRVYRLNLLVLENAREALKKRSLIL
jgi:hypothetical protein